MKNFPSEITFSIKRTLLYIVTSNWDKNVKFKKEHFTFLKIKIFKIEFKTIVKNSFLLFFSMNFEDIEKSLTYIKARINILLKC